MESFSEFCRTLIREHNRKRLMFDGVNRFWLDIIWNYNRLSDSEKIQWQKESIEIVKKNKDADLIGPAIGLMAVSSQGKSELFNLLKKSPRQSRYRWNELILTKLVDNKFRVLEKETTLINIVIQSFPTDLLVLDFMLKFAHLNQEFAVNYICNLVVKKGFGTPEVLDRYGKKIYSMLYAVEESLPAQLIACAKKGGVDISCLLMYNRN